MKHSLIISLTLVILSISSVTTHAETLYVSDVLFVPVRSGQGDQYRILHRGLRSGTQVTLLESNEETGYSLVEIPDGTKGWMRSRHLTPEPTAEIRLAQLEKKIAQTSGSNSELQNRVEEMNSSLEAARSENKDLTDENAKLTQQYDELLQLSGNVASINEKNKKLIAQNQALQIEVDSIKAANQELKDNKNLKMFIYGAILVLLTLVINSWLDGIKKKRSYGGWA